MTSPTDRDESSSAHANLDTTLHAPADMGSFTNLTPHARGGIGEVFRAIDSELNRTVAVKRLQDRYAADVDIRHRFLVEAELTARLEHPGVVPVYRMFHDEHGRPAYAMRFVDGQTMADAITGYHSGPSDPVAFRRLLQSFLLVCQTVAYSHNRGVIHRDLKPANIMLGRFGETLVLDWGLAKVVGRPEEARQARAEETLVPSPGDVARGETIMGSAVGTPSYMSPEQAAGRWDVVAQASDTYNLGAVLYTVLTGSPPLEKGNWPEIQQKIQQGDFPRPRQVKPEVPRALEAVCMKAMAVAPADRYSSVQAFAADVEHWLADEPVVAYREPIAARVRRWAKRHRPLVTGTVVLLAAAVISLSIGTILLQRAKIETDKLRQSAVAARAKAEAINVFLIDDLLKQADPEYNPVGDKLTVRELLDKAAERLEAQTSLADQPEVEATLRAVIGQAYDNLGLRDKAEQHYRRGWELLAKILGPNHLETLALRNKYVWTLTNLDRPKEAEQMAREALDACTKALGEDHPETTLASDNLAGVFEAQGRFTESEKILRHNVAVLHASIGLLDFRTLEADNNLAWSLILGGRPVEAEEVARDLVDRIHANPEIRYPEFPLLLSNLSAALQAQGRFAESEPILQEALARSIEMLGPDNRTTIACQSGLAYADEGQGKFDEAEKTYLKVLEVRRRILSPTHPATQRTIGYIARLYAKQERWHDCSNYLAQLQLAQQVIPSLDVVAKTIELEAALARTGDPKIEEILLSECVSALKATLRTGDWLTAEINSRYGDCLRRQKKFVDAETVLVTAANDIKRALGAPAWSVKTARDRVASLYVDWNKLADAAKWQ